MQGGGEVAAGHMVWGGCGCRAVEPPEQCILWGGCWSGNVVGEERQSRERVHGALAAHCSYRWHMPGEQTVVVEYHEVFHASTSVPR